MLSERTFAAVIMFVEAATGKPIPKVQADAYFELFKDVDDAVFKRAMKLALCEPQYFSKEQTLPAPWAIWKHIPQAAPASLSDRAKEAWGRVLKAIKVQGERGSVDFDPITNATIRSMGGWMLLCGKDSDELAKWTAKEFMQNYESISRCGVIASDQAAPLLGLNDAEHSRDGYSLTNIVKLPPLLPAVPVNVQPARIEYVKPATAEPVRKPRALPANPIATLAASFDVPKPTSAELDQPVPAMPHIVQPKRAEPQPIDRPKLTLSQADAARLAAIRDKHNSTANPPNKSNDQPPPTQRRA